MLVEKVQSFDSFSFNLGKRDTFKKHGHLASAQATSVTAISKNTMSLVVRLIIVLMKLGENPPVSIWTWYKNLSSSESTSIGTSISDHCQLLSTLSLYCEFSAYFKLKYEEVSANVLV